MGSTGLINPPYNKQHPIEKKRNNNKQNTSLFKQYHPIEKKYYPIEKYLEMYYPLPTNFYVVFGIDHLPYLVLTYTGILIT